MTFKDTKAIFVRNFQTKAKGDICDTRGKFSRVSACKGLCMVQQLCHDFLCSIGERLRVPTLLNSLLGLDCDHRLTTNLLICQNYLYLSQWRIQEFQNGGARSRRGTIFRSGVCFDAPSNIPYVFVARVVNKIHNINIVN